MPVFTKPESEVDKATDSDYMISIKVSVAEEDAEALLTLNNYDVAMPVPEKRSRGRGL